MSPDSAADPAAGVACGTGRFRGGLIARWRLGDVEKTYGTRHDVEDTDQDPLEEVRPPIRTCASGALGEG